MNAETMWEYLTAVIFAGAGGLAKLLSKKNKKSLTWLNIVSDVFVAIFMGVMAMLVVKNFTDSGNWSGVICGLAGWAGPAAINGIARFVKAGTGVDLINEEEKKK